MANDLQRKNTRDVAGGEQGLLAALRNGDLSAFEQVYRHYRPRLSRFVGNVVRRPATAEEVVNDTLMVLWEKAESFQGQSRLSTWLFAIAYRKAIRARMREEVPVDDSGLAGREDAQAPPDLGIGQQRVARMLREAIDELSPEHRAVVHLSYFQELGYREIAQIMECPEDTVKTRMFHARRHLKRKLGGALADWL